MTASAAKTSNLGHSELCRMLIRAEAAGGLSLKRVCDLAEADSAPRNKDAMELAS